MKLFWTHLVALSVLTCSLHAQYEYTGDGDNDSWSNNENWKKGAQDPALDFPDKGASATIPAVSSLLGLELDSSISLSDFFLNPNQQFVLKLEGNTLEVDFLNEDGATSIIRDGQLVTDSINIGDLRVINTTFTIGGGTIFGSGLNILNGSQVTNNGVLNFTGSSLASGDSSTLFINNGTINREGGASFDSPLWQRGGIFSASQGSLSFNKAADLSGGVIHAKNTDTVINFLGSTTVNGVKLQIDTGARIMFNGALTAGNLQNSTQQSGAELVIATGNNTFTVSTITGAENAPVIIDSGIQDTNTLTTTTSEVQWSGGTLHNFNNTGTLNIQASGGTTSPRTLTGTLNNTGTSQLRSGITLNADSLFQNSAGGTLQTNSTINPASGALESSSLVNAGTIETSLSTGASSIATKFKNTGKILITKGSLTLSGASELGGEVELKPSSSNAKLTIGGISNDTVHTIQGLSFKASAPISDDDAAAAVFSRGQYKLKGSMSSNGENSGVQSSVTADRGTWIVEEASTLDFDEALPFELGQENTWPIFRLDAALQNSGHLSITRATIIGEKGFTNTGTISARRLAIGDDNSNGTLKNQGDITVEGGSSPFIEILTGSSFTNEDTLTLVDNARIQSPVDATASTFTNAGKLIAAAPSRGKNINLIYRQKGGSDPTAELQSGTLNFTRKAEFEEGTLKTSSIVTFQDEVEWGKSLTPKIVFESSGKVQFSASQKEFKVYDTLVGEGDGTFELKTGNLIPNTDIATLDFKGDSSFVMSGGILGSYETTLQNTGNLTHNQNLLQGSFNNAGHYTLNLSGKIETYPVDDLTFDGETGQFLNVGKFSWNGGTFAGVFKNLSPAAEADTLLSIASGRLIEDSTLENDGSVVQTGPLRLESGATINLNSDFYDLVNFASISKAASDDILTEMNVKAGATLIATTSSTTPGQSSINLDAFTLEGGTIIAANTHLTINSAGLELKGGTIELTNSATLTLKEISNDDILDSLTVEKDCLLDVSGEQGFNPYLEVRNISGQGRVIGNVIQYGILDALAGRDPEESEDPQETTSYVPTIFDGDLTQTQGDSLETVVRSNGEDTSTINVLGEANITGPLTIFGDGLEDGDVIPLVTAGDLNGTFLGVPSVISTNPNLSATVEYTDTSATATIVDSDPGSLTQYSYDVFTYSLFQANDRSDPTRTAPEADADNDGASNYEEYLLGSAPTDGIPPAYSMVNSFSLNYDSVQDAYYPSFELNISPDRSDANFTIDILDPETGFGSLGNEIPYSYDLGQPKLFLLGTDPVSPDDPLFFQVQASF